MTDEETGAQAGVPRVASRATAEVMEISPGSGFMLRVGKMLGDVVEPSEHLAD